jgi:hypothetical protein
MGFFFFNPNRPDLKLSIFSNCSIKEEEILISSVICKVSALKSVRHNVEKMLFQKARLL